MTDSEQGKRIPDRETNARGKEAVVFVLESLKSGAIRIPSGGSVLELEPQILALVLNGRG